MWHYAPFYLFDFLFQAWYFDRDDVAFNGIHGYLKTKSREEREHAEKLMRYQNMRGGRIVLQDIKVCHI